MKDAREKCAEELHRVLSEDIDSEEQQEANLVRAVKRLAKEYGASPVEEALRDMIHFLSRRLK